MQLNAIGDAYAKSKVITREAATVTVQDLIYKGASIRIDNREITGDRILHEEHTGGFIHKHTSDQSKFQSSSSITVKDITLYLGDAAAGVFIDVSEKSGVRQVGIRNEEQIWMEAGSTLTFGNIANYLPGYAYLYGSVTGLTVYDQSMLPALTVITVFQIYPICKSFLMGFYTDFDYLKDEVYAWGFDNFRNLMNDSDFALAIRNTVRLTLVAAPLSILTSLLFGPDNSAGRCPASPPGR